MAGPGEYITRNPHIARAIAAFVGVSWYLSIELNIRIFMTFKRRTGLYFWSCLTCSWGLMLNQVFGAVLWDFGVTTNIWIVFPGIFVTWAMMILGQSLVLYSRLHLVMDNRNHLRWVLGMIIVTAIGIVIPTIIVGLVHAKFGNPNYILDKIQIVTFFLQETILSALYIWKTKSYLKTGAILGNNKTKKHNVMRHLIYVNLIIIFLDIVILVLSYIPGIFYIQAALKPATYGVKLRLEFSILNRLVESVKHSQASSDNQWSDLNFIGTPWNQAVWNPRPPSLARIESFSHGPLHEHIVRPENTQSGNGFKELGAQGSVVSDRVGSINITQVSVEPNTKEVTKTSNIS